MKLFILLLLAILIGSRLSDTMPHLFVQKTVQVSTVALAPTTTPSRPEMVYELAKGFEQYGTDVMNESFDVAKNESGWRHDAQGWNCIYDGKSQACKKQDRHLAWSVDCGLLQINVKGKVCPQELFDIKVNISRAVAMYERRGWSPWVAARSLGYVR